MRLSPMVVAGFMALCSVGGVAAQSLERLIEMERARAEAAKSEDAQKVETEQAAEPGVLDDDAMAVHVLNRLAFGPRPGDVQRVRAMGWKAWVEQQLKPEEIDDPQVASMLEKRFPSMGMSMTQVFRKYRPAYEGMAPTEEEQKRRQMLRNKVRSELVDSVLLRAVDSERQFQEVIVNFWRNHFNVDQNKNEVEFLANNYETEVIRKYAFDHFGKMLMASAKHPAMLVYLDNAISQRPPTRHEQKLFDRYDGRDRVPYSVRARMRQRGLNENYAREVMELHTFGVRMENVRGGYYQSDVVDLARVLTGWSVGWQGGQYGFQFKENYHDPDEKRVLGIYVDSRGGVEDGERVLALLSLHANTAHFISWKLCRYLVNDNPDEKLVREVAAVYRRHKGYLPEVYKAIIFSDAFASEANHRVKFKTPFEFAASALRAVDADVKDPHHTQRALMYMGQPTYHEDDPTGYYDQAEAWMDPGVMIYRWDFAMKLARNRMKGVQIGSELNNRFHGLKGKALKDALVEALLGGDVAPNTDKVLNDNLKAGQAKLLGLVLGSPDFQQQ